MIIVLLADGFEEIEALTPVDMLRRAGLTVKTVGISGKTVSGAHGIAVVCDLLPDEVDLSLVNTVILPGGMPGTPNLYDSDFTEKAVRDVLERGGRVAAICAAPLILGRYDLLNKKAATCYPGFENELVGAYVTDQSVITDGQITTARGMGVALEFSEELISLILGEEKAEEISKAICEERPKEDEYAELPLDDWFDLDDEFDEYDEPIEDTVLEDDSPVDAVACPEKKEYSLPTLDALAKDEPMADGRDEVAEMAKIIDSTLSQNKVKAEITSFERGATITRFSLIPAKDTFVKQILKLKSGLTLALGGGYVRFIAPIPGQRQIGLEVPNKTRSIVRFRGVAESEAFKNNESITSVCLGRDVNNNPVIADIARLPHMLVAGATGMGKSVAIHSMIASLLLKADPDKLKLMLIDPKQVEFTAYEDIPHLITPIIHDSGTAAGALSWAVEEMERRYSLLAEAGVRNITAYNSMEERKETLPFVIIIIDELSDLMLCAKDDVEISIVRLAQKARAAGIHLIIGTQRPTPSVITGVIKANIPSRLCCKVISVTDSRTVIDQSGAEDLVGMGDALYLSPGSYTPTRIQCAFISDSESHIIADAVKAGNKEAQYNATLKAYIEHYFFKRQNPILFDKDFRDAVGLAVATRRISISLLQRTLNIGYVKGSRFIDHMEKIGIVSPFNANRPREVLISPEEWETMLSKFDNQ